MTMQYQKEIEAFFHRHRDDFLADLSALIAIKSVGGEARENAPYGSGPKKALEYMLALAKGKGFACQEIAHRIGCVDMNMHRRAVDILTHLDVVPAEQGWTKTAPFSPRIEGNRLYGRGAIDDKGPAMAALYALWAVKELGIPLSKNVRLVMGTDEERGSSDIPFYYQIHKEAPLTFTPDGSFPLVHGEKGGFFGSFSGIVESGGSITLLEICAGQQGNVIPDKAQAWVSGVDMTLLLSVIQNVEQAANVHIFLSEQEDVVQINVLGTGGHAAHPEAVNNPLPALLALLSCIPFEGTAGHAIQELHRMFPVGDWSGAALGLAQEHPVMGRLTISPTVLSLHEGVLNGHFDARTAEDILPETVAAVEEQFCQAGLVLRTKCVPIHLVPTGMQGISTLLRCYEAYTQEKGYPQVSGGMSYVHGLRRGVVFGCEMPGDDHHMHGADEYADIDALLLSGMMFAQAIVELCTT